MSDSTPKVQAKRAVVFLMKDDTRYTYMEFEPLPNLATNHLIVKERKKKGRWSVIGRVQGFEIQIDRPEDKKNEETNE
jgi:hypothetical protein